MAISAGQMPCELGILRPEELGSLRFELGRLECGFGRLKVTNLELWVPFGYRIEPMAWWFSALSPKEALTKQAHCQELSCQSCRCASDIILKNGSGTHKYTHGPKWFLYRCCWPQ